MTMVIKSIKKRPPLLRWPLLALQLQLLWQGASAFTIPMLPFSSHCSSSCRSSSTALYYIQEPAEETAMVKEKVLEERERAQKAEITARALLKTRMLLKDTVRKRKTEITARALLKTRMQLEESERARKAEIRARALFKAHLENGLKAKKAAQTLVQKQKDTISTLVQQPAAAAFLTCASENPDPTLALDELVQTLEPNSSDEATLVFLFVGQYHANNFEKIVEYAQAKLDKVLLSAHNAANIVEVVVVLGGGVIGGGNELDTTETPAMTLLAGSLPPDSYATVFQYEEGVNEELPEDILAAIETDQEAESKNSERRPASYMVFADPFAPLEALLARLDEPSHQNPALAPPVVAGGVSVPPHQRRVPSVACNGRILPAGSLVGVAFTGNVGLLTVVAQGCRPVGPTFVITQASNTILTGLSGESAISQLELVAKDAEAQDQELIRNGELVCGIGSTNSAMVDPANVIHGDSGDAFDNNDDVMVNEDAEGASDFLIRQIKGFQPKSGSIVVAAGGLKEGSTFRFHVRAAQSAQEDMELMIQRAKTERLFAGSSSLFKTGPGAPSVTKGKPLAAFQFSCVARGSSFYGAPNMDLNKVQDLFEDGSRSGAVSPIAGFFANGEIGPVGIRMAEMAAKDAEQWDRTSSSTFLHGFTTVVAMLCDYGGAQTSQSTEEQQVSTDAIMSSTDDAWA